MPALPIVLSNKVRDNIHNYMKTAYPYGGPMSGQITLYFEEFCTAIGSGIVNESLGKIKWVSKDAGFMGAPPIPGVGIGKGIFVDKAWFNENLYKKIGSLYKNLPPYPPGTKTTTWIDIFGTEHEDIQEVHPPYPNKSDYSNGMFVECITQGIADAVEDHYKTAWILQGTHPLIYLGKGKVSEGKFNGLIAPTIATAIQGLAPHMSGNYWIQMTNAIAEVYVDAIHNHSKSGKIAITGVCVPSPTPPQVCLIPSVGAGIGDAL